MSKKIPTIEDVLNEIDYIAREYDPYQHGLPTHKGPVFEEMKKQIKDCIELHVKAALEAASKQKTYGMLVVPLFNEEQQKSILNAYPENLIK